MPCVSIASIASSARNYDIVDKYDCGSRQDRGCGFGGTLLKRDGKRGWVWCWDGLDLGYGLRL